MSSQPQSSSVTVTQDDEIPMSSALPDGWYAREANGLSLSYDVSSDPQDSLYHNSVTAQRYEKSVVREIFAIARDAPVTIDVAEWANDYQIDTQNFKDYSDTEGVPQRLIGNTPAYGYTYIDHTGDDPVRRWEWLVGRPDGVWLIAATSTSTEPTIPTDVATVLDTITWAPAH